MNKPLRNYQVPSQTTRYRATSFAVAVAVAAGQLEPLVPG